PIADGSQLLGGSKVGPLVAPAPYCPPLPANPVIRIGKIEIGGRGSAPRPGSPCRAARQRRARLVQRMSMPLIVADHLLTGAKKGARLPATPTGKPARSGADQRRGAARPGGVSPGAEREARLPVLHEPHCEAPTGVADPLTT